MAKPRPLPRVNLEDTEGESAMFDELAGKPANRVIVEISPDLIDPSPQQSRTVFDPVDIADFANVMQEVGFTSVIWVRPHPKIPGRYILIFGERRLRAAKEVVKKLNPKFTKIACEVRSDIVDPEVLEFIGFFENKQRQDLSPYDEALYYRKLLDRRDQGKATYTIEKLAKRAHETENHVRDRLFLLDLPEDALEAYKQNPHMALRSLREVCRLENPGQRAPWLALLVQNALSREDLRQNVQAILEESNRPMEPIPVLANAAGSEVEARETTQTTEIEQAVVIADQPHEAAFTIHVAEPHTEQKSEQSVSTPFPTTETPVIRSQARENNDSGTASAEEYRKGQLQSYRTMLARDTKSLQAIFDRWVGFLDQDSEIAGIFQEGIRKAASLFGEAREQKAPEPDALP